jgi:hypothetical protein
LKPFWHKCRGFPGWIWREFQTKTLLPDGLFFGFLAGFLVGFLKTFWSFLMGVSVKFWRFLNKKTREKLGIRIFPQSKVKP